MKKLYATVIFVIFFCSVIPLTYGQKVELNNAAIEIAITDFLKCRLSEKSGVFSVSIYEGETDDRYKIIDNIIVISVVPIENIEPYYRITLVDTLGSARLPTRHMIKDGKLFYWRDSDYSLTEETIKAFLEFNLAEPMNISDLSLLLGYEGYYSNTKAAQYYFCKKDLSTYKRVITSIAPGWYKPPQMKCK